MNWVAIVNDPHGGQRRLTVCEDHFFELSHRGYYPKSQSETEWPCAVCIGDVELEPTRRKVHGTLRSAVNEAIERYRSEKSPFMADLDSFDDWIVGGLLELEGYLAKHAAFLDYLEAEHA